MTKKILLFIALLCAFAQGAWAQANWEAVYAMTNTNSGNWTALTEGSTTGHTLGSAGNTTYYYPTGNLNFTNSNAGGSGLTILGTVYLYVPDGVTITCTGANANAPTGAGAGIELASGNTLYLLGGGTINATGGNAANGGNGGTGGNAGGEWDKWTSTGAGGTGGNGGGGAGAGIGTRGGNGGSGGAGGSSNTYHDDSSAHNGTNGSTGNAGSTADAMGNLYVVSSFVHLSATGGAAGTSGGSGGQRGRGRIDDDNPNYSVSGGGGGGGGGFGGAASNIGTGGPGGGGGGGGAGGAQDYKYSGYYDVTSYGGNGGQNADGSYAATGTEAPTTRIAMENNWVDTNYAWGNNDANPPSNQCTFGSGGSGAAKGNASTAGTANNVIGIDASGSYVIGSATDWNTFAAQVANGTDSYSGKSLKLMADISVTTMVGNCDQWGHPYKPFQGTFDGNGHTLTFTCGTSSEPYNINYCAPFRNVDGATIQNLKVAGNIYTSQEDAGGLVSYCKGTTSIIGCYVSTIIHSSKSGYGYHGGIVAESNFNTLNITGCVYTGRLLTNNGTTKCGGFGYTYNVHLSISNSLYAPSGSIPEGWTAINDGATFVQGSTISYNLTNYYYTETLGTAQGTQAVVSSPFNLGSLMQDYGMLKAYEHGIIYNGTCYVDANMASAETGTEDDPYTISSTDDWNGFANAVTGGYTFSGQFVKLNADIEVSTMAGADDANSFQGTFVGDGHTMTFTKGTSESPFNETYCAPFRHVKNATIKNMHVDGTIYTSVQKAAGFVGESHGALNITNCHSSININSSKSGDGTHGGFVATLSGAGNEITIEGCVFDGSFATTANTTNCGGFIGWGVYNKPTVRNSLMKPSSVPASMLINTFARWYTGDEGIYEPTITNCYYVETTNLPTNQGTKAYAFATAPANLGAAGTDYGMVKAYANGIFFNGTYYVPSTGNISLSVEGYGTGNDKWAFIASPVNSNIAPTAVSNIFSATEYDLYRLNPSSSTWENYQAHTGDFNLVNGKGYLYATKETKTLVFSGTFNIDNQKMVGLSTGFNLVGNPFIVDAYASRSYYRMNAEGTDIEVIENYAATTIPVCTGVVVRATGPYESITFSTEAPVTSTGNNGNLQMTLTKAGARNDAFQDKAIVSFNEGSQLEKFVFNERHAKLYIPQYGEDYAIAFSDMSGEVPLNFKANETGRYTINFNFENVKGVRIQLIDKLEDRIIDLNANDSYTFMGSTVDRSDRFTLVFTQVETDGIFAYQSGDGIVVSGEGELQVFDVMGRMVMNQRISGVQTVEKPSQTGVYIFRLNGKTQKIVVR